MLSTAVPFNIRGPGCQRSIIEREPSKEGPTIVNEGLAERRPLQPSRNLEVDERLLLGRDEIVRRRLHPIVAEADGGLGHEDDADEVRRAEVRVETGAWKVEELGERVEVEAR
jgi:hypothetical protein